MPKKTETPAEPETTEPETTETPQPAASPYIEDDPQRLADLQYGRGEFAPDNPKRPQFVVGRDGAGRRCLIPV